MSREEGDRDYGGGDGGSKDEAGVTVQQRPGVTAVSGPGGIVTVHPPDGVAEVSIVQSPDGMLTPRAAATSAPIVDPSCPEETAAAIEAVAETGTEEDGDMEKHEDANDGIETGAASNTLGGTSASR